MTLAEHLPFTCQMIAKLEPMLSGDIFIPLRISLYNSVTPRARLQV